MLLDAHPYLWFWLADDGRVYSSARQVVIDTTDPTFAGWVEAGATPSPWPKDAAGQQTNAALQDEIADYGLFVTDTARLVAIAAAARYAKETGGITVGNASIDTSRESQTMVANAFAFMQQSGAASTSYKTASGWVTVSADQLKAIALAVGAHVQACFAIESDVAAKITAGTIRTPAAIDAAFAAPTT